MKIDREAASVARFCASCATFVGGECWVEGAACRSCVDAGQARAALGLLAVRRAARQLAMTRSEVDGLEAIARVSNGEAPQLGLEAWFARQRARLVRDAARRAATATAPRYEVRLRPLETEITASFVDIVSRLDALEAGNAGVARTRRVRLPRISPTQRQLVLVAGVALVAVLLVPRLLDLGTAPGGSLAGAGVPTSSPEDGVAGNRGTPGQAPAAGTAAPGAPVSMTFDELRMGSPIGDELSIERGAEAQVSVSARPTSVDRSLRLMTDARGVGPVVCMDTAFEVRTMELELLLSDERASVEVMVGDSGARGRLIIEPGRIEFNGTDAPAAIEAERWYRAGIEREDSFGLASAFVASVDGNGHDRFIARAPDAPTSADASAVCIGLADGEPGIELLINNVEVRQ